MSSNLFPLLLVGGAAAAVVYVATRPAAAGSGGGVAPGQVQWKGKTLVSSTACQKALAQLPPALMNRLVKSDLTDLVELGSDVEKMGLTKASSCLWAAAARTRIDMLGEACDSALLALPATVLKDTATRVREAKSAGDLRLVAASLKSGGFKDASDCIAARADAVEVHLSEEEKILGRSLVSTGVCDARLFELPDESFKKILAFISSASWADLRKLADGLVTSGFPAAAQCVRERADALEKSGGDTGGALRGGLGLEPGKMRMPGEKKPITRLLGPSGMDSSLTSTLSGVNLLVKDIPDAAGGDPDALRKQVAAVLTRLRTFKGNLETTGYGVGELLDLAALIAAEAPVASAEIKDAADEINLIRYWPSFAGSPVREQAKSTLSGIRRFNVDASTADVGPTEMAAADSATDAKPSDRMSDIKNLYITVDGTLFSAPAPELNQLMIDIAAGRERIRQDF